MVDGGARLAWMGIYPSNPPTASQSIATLASMRRTRTRESEADTGPMRAEHVSAARALMCVNSPNDAQKARERQDSFYLNTKMCSCLPERGIGK